MKGELTAIIEKAPEGGYWAICPEIPGANGQGESIEDAKESLKQAVMLILNGKTRLNPAFSRPISWHLTGQAQIK
jgi:predicted RNase H-like HicB family nuclease